MSDRDKKLVYLMLIIMIVLLPYFFFIKDKKTDTETVNDDNAALESRLEELELMNQNREMYVTETANMKAEMVSIINEFPSDVKQENYTMFLLNTEYQSCDYYYDADEFLKTGEIVQVDETYPSAEPLWNFPIWFQATSYGANVENPISSDNADTGYVSISNKSVLTYTTSDYWALKDMLKYLRDFQDPMVCSTITMEFAEETGNIQGEITLDQFAVRGSEREIGAVVISPKVEDAYGRGLPMFKEETKNDDTGLFGKKKTVVLGEDDEEDNSDADEPDDDEDENR